MATKIRGRRASPTYFSEDDSEDDGLDLDAYLKVGAVQKQEVTRSSRGGSLRGGADKENIEIPKTKTGTRSNITDSGHSERATAKNSSMKSKAAPKVEESTVKVGEDLAALSLSDTPSTRKSKRTQRPLKAAQVNSLLLPLSQSTAGKDCAKRSQSVEKGSFGKEDGEQEREGQQHESQDVFHTPKPVRRERNNARTTSKRSTKKEVKYHWPPSDEEKVDDTFDSLADFIVSDNEDVSLYKSHEDSDEDKETPKSFQENKPRRRLIRGQTPKTTLKKKDTTGYKESASNGALSHEPFDLSLPPQLHLKPTTQPKGEKAGLGKPCHSEHGDEPNEPDALLKHSPPQPGSPPPTMGARGFVTPPSSPSKARLKSPSKEKQRIPASPHRPSIDAFWSQDVINDWNDQYSPRKEQTPFRRRMLTLLGEDEEDETPLNTSPKKGGASPTKASSPTKARAAAAEAKKALAKKKKEFDERKVALAESFFKELDDKVTGGEIQKLAEATGGVKIIWSKKLNSTAGRANWKREILRSRPSPTSSSSSTDTEQQQQQQQRQTSRHHATIELAEKVIDSDDRLINTLAHEYCHLTNFMISNIRTHPHGTSFKEWARKCTEAFASHPVYGGGAIKVTTKHSYVISYKYIWCCEGCGLEYGRHSKSIDPLKVRCGRCKGGLRQVKPTPRRPAGAPSPQKKKGGDVGKISPSSSLSSSTAKGAESPVVVDMLVDEEDASSSGNNGSGVETVTNNFAGVKLRS